uniref:Uncharacterized protein n=1 Tax=Rhizophora mucronata TaxID=61149 RepID=A0A2P2J511_RHIMU
MPSRYQLGVHILQQPPLGAKELLTQNPIISFLVVFPLFSALSLHLDQNIKKGSLHLVINLL